MNWILQTPAEEPVQTPWPVFVLLSKLMLSLVSSISCELHAIPTERRMIRALLYAR